MKRAHYHFETTWNIPAPIENVADTLLDIEHWPTWWPYVHEAKLLVHTKQPHGLGSRGHIIFKSVLPYTLAFDFTLVHVTYPTLFKGEARGDCTGTGTWKLSDKNGQTEATYIWDIDTTKPWMNICAPILRPLFILFHDHVMKRGEQGLTSHLT